MSWLICDMDDGVLRRERTKRVAVEWFAHWLGIAPDMVLTAHSSSAPLVQTPLVSTEASGRWTRWPTSRTSASSEPSC